jgi:CheY-like chemotaxis protein/MinD-like ATPase involved in chromosome partitioning or flagellar assembly
LTDKILLVDDDAETVRLLSLVLKHQGYEVLPAYEGVSAIQLAHTEHPDLILLDIMMPGIDGYQVTRSLRSNPDSANIPVLMFSAKKQVEDRVAGYESGIDDYLSKPIHPAELIARVKSLMSRSKLMGSTFGEKGYTVGVLGVKGGIGVSSFTLNLAISYRQHSQKDVIGVELRPGYGTWLTSLNMTQNDGLSRLLKLNPSDITTSAANEQLQAIYPGIQLLTAGSKREDIKLLSATEQLKKIVKLLPLLASMVLLDLGAGELPNLSELTHMCDEIYVLMNSFPSNILSTQRVINDLAAWGFGKDKPLNVVLMRQSSQGLPSSIKDIEDFLQTPIKTIMPVSPEIAFQAETQAKPLLSIQPDSELNRCYAELAKNLIKTAQNR